MTTRREEIERAIETLPPISSAATTVLSMVGEPSFALADLKPYIECDATLTLRLLKIANSPLMGAREEIESVDHAVALLGEQQVVATALAAGAADLLSSDLRAYDVTSEQLLTSSVYGGVAARIIAARLSLDGASPTSAFTAALLRDIGKVAISNALDSGGDPESAGDSLAKADFDENASNDDFLAHERAQLGLDHCEVGALVAGHYGLSEAQTAAVRFHHTPSAGPEEYRSLLDVVHLADIVSLMVGGAQGAGGMTFRMDTDSTKRLGLSGNDLQEVMLECLVEADDAVGLIQVGSE